MSFETHGVDLLQLEERPDREINQKIGYSSRCLIPDPPLPVLTVRLGSYRRRCTRWPTSERSELALKNSGKFALLETNRPLFLP